MLPFGRNDSSYVVPALVLNLFELYENHTLKRIYESVSLTLFKNFF